VIYKISSVLIKNHTGYFKIILCIYKNLTGFYNSPTVVCISIEGLCIFLAGVYKFRTGHLFSRTALFNIIQESSKVEE